MNITREQIKKAIIPMLYGSKAKPKELFGADTPELLAFNAAVHKNIPALAKMHSICASCWDPKKKWNQFTMPDGHVVRLPNLVKKQYNVTLGNAKFPYVTKVFGNTTNSTPLLAHITHAVDAYINREMVRRAHMQGFQMASIHDSFWASPIYMNLVRYNYRDILVEIAKSDLLKDIVYQLGGDPSIVEYAFPDLWKEIKEEEYAIS